MCVSHGDSESDEERAPSMLQESWRGLAFFGASGQSGAEAGLIK